MNKKRSRDLSDLGGMVYSTDDSFVFDDDSAEETFVDPKKQKLRVLTDKKQRKGKIVTLIEGFEGSAEQITQLSKQLKNLCGAGGSAKDGVILIQGDFKSRVADFLQKAGYSVKILG